MGASGHWDYELYSKKTGSLAIKGTSGECADYIGVTPDHFRRKVWKSISSGAHPHYFGSRTWIKPEKQKLQKQAKSEGLCSPSWCGRCKHYAHLDGWSCCTYLFDTDQRRPCKAGTGCTVREIGPRDLSSRNNFGSLARDTSLDYWREIGGRRRRK